MVSYRDWVSVLFETYPEADATEVVAVAGRTWTENKPLLSSSSLSEAREYAKQVG